MHDQPEDVEARKRRESGPAEDSAARLQVEYRETEHALFKAALRTPAAGSFATVTKLGDYIARGKPRDDHPPRTPGPKSPNRQGKPVEKIETNAFSKHDQRLGDLLIEKLAARIA